MWFNLQWFVDLGLKKSESAWIDKALLTKKSRNHSRQLTASALEKVCLHWYLTGGSCPDKDVSDWTVTAISGVSFLTLGQNMALLTLETCRTDPFQMLPKKGNNVMQTHWFHWRFSVDHRCKRPRASKAWNKQLWSFRHGDLLSLFACKLSLGRFLLVQSHPDLEVQNMMTAEYFCFGK